MSSFEILAQNLNPSDLNISAVVVYVLFGGFMGFVFRSLPGIRWAAAIAWCFIVLDTGILLAWWSGFFWMSWSFAIVFALRWKDKFLEAATFEISLPSPSGSIWAYRFRVFFRGLWRVIWWIIKVLWKFLCELTFFLFITFPVCLMRLCFWLYRTIPKLRTLEGWLYLLKGIGIWLWYLVPWQIRSEWDRLVHGKSVHESFQEEMNKVYEREKEKRRKREERELRSSFRRFKKFVKKLAKKGISPEDFAREQEAYEQSQRQEQQESSRSEQGSSHGGSSSDFRERHRQQKRSEQRQRYSYSKQREQRQQSSSQSSRSNQSSQSSRYSQSTYQAPPKEEKKEITPLDKEYYDKHRASFARAQWEYSVSEERFKKYDQTKLRSEAYKILDIAEGSDTKTVKKAKRDLSKRYLKYTYPIHPSEVNARANQIMAVVNHAAGMLLK